MSAEYRSVISLISGAVQAFLSAFPAYMKFALRNPLLSQLALLKVPGERL